MLQSRPFPETRPSLLCSLRDGRMQQSAWREFFERYAPAVFRVARLGGLDSHDAEDIVQQVMLSISTHIGEFDYQRDCGRFRRWVKTIANNKIRDRFRRRQTDLIQVAGDGCPERADAGPSLDAVWDQEWKVQEILYCLDEVAVEFAPKRVLAFRLYVLEGLSADETATELGMTRGHVYVTRCEILSRIRDRLQHHDEGNA